MWYEIVLALSVVPQKSIWQLPRASIMFLALTSTTPASHLSLAEQGNPASSFAQHMYPGQCYCVEIRLAV